MLVGKADHEDKYSRSLKKSAEKNKDIVLTGFLSGVSLRELYSHAGIFVLPSYYEGLPLVLLEALSYGLSCIVTDIPANREIKLPEDRFFKAGDVQQLTEKIANFIDIQLPVEEKVRLITMVAERYNWDKITDATFEIYSNILAS